LVWGSGRWRAGALRRPAWCGSAGHISARCEQKKPKGKPGRHTSAARWRFRGYGSLRAHEGLDLDARKVTWELKPYPVSMVSKNRPRPSLRSVEMATRTR
jgi:hypothetical protein